jgi:hypothetical protein
MDTQTDQATHTYRSAQSQITRRAHAYARELGIAYSTAYARATEEVGQEMTPPMTVGELNSWIARERHAELRQKAQEEPKAAKKKAAPKAEKSVNASYRAWCLENDVVAPDSELAHFNGHTAAAFGAARSNLKKEGFEFERVEAGWRITARPAPKVEARTYSEEEFRQAVSEATSAAIGPAVNAAVTDALAKLKLA